jgi:protein-disulfide isomerase
MSKEPGVPRLTVPIREHDHIRGPAEAPFTLLEYGDFECPYCGQAYGVIKEIQRTFGNQLRFVFRNFPFTKTHPHAQHAAEAAEAAAAQGKFWEMHDYLYEHQRALEDHHLRKYAIILKLDLDRFDRDISQHTYATRVREDFLSGVKSGANGAPAFFINDVRYDGSWNFEELLKALEERKV